MSEQLSIHSGKHNCVKQNLIPLCQIRYFCRLYYDNTGTHSFSSQTVKKGGRNHYLF